MRKKLLALTLIAAVLVLLSGCLNTNTKTFKDKSGGKVTIDQKNGKIKLKNKKGESSAEFGENVSVPKGFPKDIPIYKGAKINVSISNKTKRGDISMVTFEVNASYKKVTDYYRKKLNDSGYKISGTFSTGKLTTFTAEKDNSRVTISVSQNKDNTMVSINVGDKINNGGQ